MKWHVVEYRSDTGAYYAVSDSSDDVTIGTTRYVNNQPQRLQVPITELGSLIHFLNELREGLPRERRETDDASES